MRHMKDREKTRTRDGTTHGPQMSQGQNREKIGTRHEKDSKLDRQDRDHKWRIQAHHLDLKRGKNTFTVELQHIYSRIAAHLQYYCSTFTALLQYIYSIIALHLQHYCSTVQLQHNYNTF